MRFVVLSGWLKLVLLQRDLQRPREEAPGPNAGGFFMYGGQPSRSGLRRLNMTRPEPAPNSIRAIPAAFIASAGPVEGSVGRLVTGGGGGGVVVTTGAVVVVVSSGSVVVVTSGRVVVVTSGSVVVVVVVSSGCVVVVTSGPHFAPGSYSSGFDSGVSAEPPASMVCLSRSPLPSLSCLRLAVTDSQVRCSGGSRRHRRSSHRMRRCRHVRRTPTST